MLAIADKPGGGRAAAGRPPPARRPAGARRPTRRRPPGRPAGSAAAQLSQRRVGAGIGQRLRCRGWLAGGRGEAGAIGDDRLRDRVVRHGIACPGQHLLDRGAAPPGRGTDFDAQLVGALAGRFQEVQAGHDRLPVIADGQLRVNDRRCLRADQHSPVAGLALQRAERVGDGAVVRIRAPDAPQQDDLHSAPHRLLQRFGVRGTSPW